VKPDDHVIWIGFGCDSGCAFVADAADGRATAGIVHLTARRIQECYIGFRR